MIKAQRCCREQNQKCDPPARCKRRAGITRRKDKLFRQTPKRNWRLGYDTPGAAAGIGIEIRQERNRAQSENGEKNRHISGVTAQQANDSNGHGRGEHENEVMNEALNGSDRCQSRGDDDCEGRFP